MNVYDRGLRLKMLRENRGLSQVDVAKRLGLSRATISAYERNLKSPRLEVLEQMAILYRSSVDYILGLEQRTSLFIDDLTLNQQQTIKDIVEILRAEFNRE